MWTPEQTETHEKYMAVIAKFRATGYNALAASINWDLPNPTSKVCISTGTGIVLVNVHIIYKENAWWFQSESLADRLFPTDTEEDRIFLAGHFGLNS
jgi:hypothetical protein